MIPEFDLTGKVALVTGAGRGIGTGIGEVFAEAGADVVLNALTPRWVERRASAIAEATGRKVVAVVADVTRPHEVTEMMRRVLGAFGRLDILVNNLGDSIPGPLVSLPGAGDAGVTDADVAKVLDLNLVAAVHCTRAVGRHLLERRTGKVINVSSYSARRARANQTLYTAAKTALLGFTQSLAVEWAPFGIQVNAIAPGVFPDVLTVGEDGYRRAVVDAERRVPLGRVGQLREVGLLALYLASAASDYMTGQVLCLDGGLTA